MMRLRTAVTALMVACVGGDTSSDTSTDAADDEVGLAPGVWDQGLPPASSLGAPRGLVARRAVFHLHSPYSHDACDGAGYVDGALDTVCADQLRQALCDASYDLAFVTDHPDYGDAQPSLTALLHAREGDTPVMAGGVQVGNEVRCDDGHVVRWRPGFEDELMPVALHEHVDPDQATRHDLLNRSDPSAIDAMRAAGGYVLVAHPEGRPYEALEALQDAGLHGMEVFNMHAMFGPDIRAEALGLDPLGFIQDIAPFAFEGATAQPDLLFLAVHQEQVPTVQRLDHLLARGHLMVVGGLDAHQNVLPTLLSDGERVDSYRRTLRWFSTMLLAKGDAADDDLEAIEARRTFVTFEALGSPVGVDLHLEAAGEVFEIGSDSPVGALTVSCPTLSPWSPRDGVGEPEITVTVFRDGEVWQQGCGTWDAGPGVYRARVDMVPRHLGGFLGPDAAHLVKTYPWVYTGAIRVGLD